MKILVINQNDQARFMPYVEQYRLFNTWPKAVAAAREIGWEDPFNMGVNTKVGMANQFQCGDVKVIIIALDEQ